MTARQPGRSPLPRRLLHSDAAVLAVLVLGVLALRAPFLGNPMIHVDEQFYLLAGQRVVEGALPYVDLWDRKPVGLFLLYAAIRLLGGTGIVEYQLVAALCAALTSFGVYGIARRGVAPPAALAGAIAYAAMLAPLNGAGGQAPVFYNLPMTWAALLTLRAGDAAEGRSYRWLGLVAMACAGLAIQIKYLAAVEGLFLGLWLLWTGHPTGRQRPLSVLKLFRDATLFAGAALLPTIAATGYFWWQGALEPFLQANFISIFQRAAAPHAFEMDALSHTAWLLTLPGILAIGALAFTWLRGPRQDRAFLSLWLIFALAGFFAIGNYFDHYALPLVAPLAVILTRLFVRRVVGPVLFALLLIQQVAYGRARYAPTAETIAMTRAMTTDIRAVTRGGHCLFVADTPLVLYLTTHACGPWRYSFPFHLLDGTEAGTGEADQPGAMRAILSARPGAIVTGSPQFTPTLQQANVTLLRDTLAARYVAQGRYPDRLRTYTVWVRRDLAEAARRDRATIPGTQGRAGPTALGQK